MARFPKLLFIVVLLAVQTLRWTDCACGIACPKPGECTRCVSDLKSTPAPPVAKKSCCGHKSAKAPASRPCPPTKKCRHIEPSNQLLAVDEAARLDPLPVLPLYLTSVPAMLPEAPRLLGAVTTESPPLTGPPLYLRISTLRI